MPMMGSTMASVNATVAALEYISTPLDADATTGMSCRGERSLLLVLVSELWIWPVRCLATTAFVGTTRSRLGRVRSVTHRSSCAAPA